MNTLEEKLIDVEEVSNILGISINWIYGNIKKDTLPFNWYPIGYRKKFKKSEVFAYIERIKVPAGKTPHNV